MLDSESVKRAFAADLGVDDAEVSSHDDKVYEGSRADNGESEWLVFETEAEAERYALERVEEDLENEPEIFNQDFLTQFMEITDTDRRIIASEEADSLYDDMKDREIRDEAERAGITDDLEYLEGELADVEKEIEASGDADVEMLEGRQSELGEKIETATEALRDKLKETRENETYEALEDPVQYFVKDQGLYSIEDLMKQSFIRIDIKNAAKAAIDTDGIAHFLDIYDGEETEITDPETKTTYIVYGTN
jgi:hypothetical protein